jgi:hypothetical protein
MALSDLTASAVLKAIEEFDRLGRDAFLKKYGFWKGARFRVAKKWSLIRFKGYSRCSSWLLARSHSPNMEAILGR